MTNFMIVLLGVVLLVQIGSVIFVIYTLSKPLVQIHSEVLQFRSLLDRIFLLRKQETQAPPPPGSWKPPSKVVGPD